MTDFEDRLRAELLQDEVPIAADAEAAAELGRRTVRKRRLGLAAGALVVVAVVATLGTNLAQLSGDAVVPAGPISASPAPMQPVVSLEHSAWQVLRLRGAEPVPGTELTLRFENGAVSGSGGCNGFGYGVIEEGIIAGAYHQDGDRLTIDGPVTSLRICQRDEVNAQENSFVDALKSTARFAIVGTDLHLFDADGTVVAELVPDVDLSGWRITGIDGTALVAGREPTLMFRGPEFEVDTGCNQQGGTYQLQARRLTFDLIPHPSVFCPEEPVMAQQAALLAALGRVDRVEREDDLLRLSDGNGKVLIQAELEPTLVLRGTWKLDAVKEESRTRPRTGITLQIDDGRISGQSGCGTYTATLVTDGRSWAVSDLKRKPLRCPMKAADQADRFLNQLVAATKVSVSTKQMQLTGGDEILYFTLKE